MARVLVACEYSGRVRRAFAALGHDVLSADFEPAEDSSPYHYRGDCFDLIADQQFDLMIAHPPCTFLSVSGMHWTTRGLRDPKLTEDALAFVQRLMAAPIAKIGIENPVSVISSRIRKPDQIVNPYQFGEDASKKTCLWLKGLPPLRPTEFIEPRMVCCGAEVPNRDKYGCPNCNGEKVARPRWGNQCDSGQNKLAPSNERWKERSRTYEGVAHAMAAQWSPLLQHNALLNNGFQECSITPTTSRLARAGSSGPPAAARSSRKAGCCQAVCARPTLPGLPRWPS